MLQHENSHIEVINKNLWAVRFSLIPFIPQISYKPDPNVPVDRVPGEMAPGGLMILNKDYRQYERVKRATISAMNLKTRQINKELDDLARDPVNSPMQVIWRYCLLAELERRKIKKGGVA